MQSDRWSKFDALDAELCACVDEGSASPGTGMAGFDTLTLSALHGAQTPVTGMPGSFDTVTLNALHGAHGAEGYPSAGRKVSFDGRLMPIASPGSRCTHQRRELEDGELVLAEDAIIMYAGAIAHFRRYEERIPVRDLWEASYKAGLAHWKERELEGGAEVLQVADEARCAFDEAVSKGISVESLTQGLGRALARFQRSADCKPHVWKTVNEAMSRLDARGMVEPPLQLVFPVTERSQPSDSYFAACTKEAVQGAVRELKKSGVLEGGSPRSAEKLVLPQCLELRLPSMH